jgi:1-acyl-sn-glycerol-3-phosphate acyltransferase
LLNRPLAFIIWAYIRLFHSFKCFGVEKVPLKGRIIIVGNHGSFIDPGLIAFSVKRPMFYMAKAELFKNPALAFLMRLINSFPVKRTGADRAAMNHAMRLLNEDKGLCLFPEGTRTLDGKLGEFKSGAAYLALVTGTDIIPAALFGTYQAYAKGSGKVRFTHFKTVFADSIRVERIDARDLETIRLRSIELTTQVKEIIQRLLTEQKGG